jgi:hypothetical protein
MSIAFGYIVVLSSVGFLGGLALIVDGIRRLMRDAIQARRIEVASRQPAARRPRLEIVPDIPLD